MYNIIIEGGVTMNNKTYICIDLKSFYASVECNERGLDPLTTNLVVADSSRTEKTICLAVSPSLKKYGIPGRARLFEVLEKVKKINDDRRKAIKYHSFKGKTYDDTILSKDPYYELHRRKDICEKVLHEFGLDSPQSHIINGHTPVKVAKGDTPVRAGGKEICIDGGFCKAYQKSTGIAGYTLIFNSHGLRIKAHYPFKSIADVLANNADIDSVTTQVEMEPKRVMIANTDNGKNIANQIEGLNKLLLAYRDGLIQEHPEKSKMPTK